MFGDGKQLILTLDNTKLIWYNMVNGGDIS